MRLFGFNITRESGEKALSYPTADRGGWLPIIRESFSGAWQQNVTIKRDTVLTHYAVFACMTLIASDIAKLRLRLVQKDGDGIDREFTNAAWSPVLRKPNPIQTRLQFWEHYMLSKLANGNVYVLKVRDNRNVVTRLYVLDPQRVQPLISESGEVFYRLRADDVSQVEDEVTVPASEIIHDRFNCMFHPLVGLSPIVAGGLAAMQGIHMQQDSANFFANRAIPSGILTAPGPIKDETAQRLKTHWDTTYGPDGEGGTAVLGDGLKFEKMRLSSSDSQMIEQLQMTAEIVCSTFHVPRHKIGVGDLPNYDNVQTLNIEYLDECLQVHIEAIEELLHDGLQMPEGTRARFDLDGLLRMDSATQMELLDKAKGKLTPNEIRARLSMGPVEGGDTLLVQQQDHSLAAIAARDAMLIDQAENGPVGMVDVTPPAEPEPEDTDEARTARSMGRRTALAKALGLDAVPV